MKSYLPGRTHSRGVAMFAMSAAMALCVGASPSCRGVVLDWSLVSWPLNSLTNSFDIDSSNPGNDVRITITGDTDYITGNNPQIDSQITGGYGTSAKSLDLTTTFDTQYQQWTLTVEFLYSNGVQDVSFTILDIDAVTDPPPADQLRNIYATAVGSTNLVAPTIVGSVDNVVTGSGVNQTVTGVTPNQQSSADGNVYVSYSNTPISSFTYTFAMDSNVVLHGGKIASQHNALYDITFSKPVPEVGVAFPPCAMAAFALAFLVVRKFRLSPTASC